MRFVRVLRIITIGYGSDVRRYEPGDLAPIADPDEATAWCLRGWAEPVEVAA